MAQVTVQSGSPPAAINLGDGGGTVVNDGPSTVYYRDELPVDATANDGSLASGGSVALVGAQFFATDGRASIHYTSSSSLAAQSGSLVLGEETNRITDPAVLAATLGGDEIVPLDPTKPILVSVVASNEVAVLQLGSWSGNFQVNMGRPIGVDPDTGAASLTFAGPSAVGIFAAGESYWISTNNVGATQVIERSIAPG